MFSSFFKRKPRTNSTLPIHRISKTISENKHRGETLGLKRVCIPRCLRVSRELTALCQYTEFQKQSAKINTKDKHWEMCMYTSNMPTTAKMWKGKLQCFFLREVGNLIFSNLREKNSPKIMTNWIS